MATVIPDQVRASLVDLGRSAALVMDPVVEHESTAALADELDRDFVIFAGALYLQILLSLFLNVLRHSHDADSLIRISWHTRKFRHSDTLLGLSHILKIDTIVNEWVIPSIEHLPLHGHTHVRLTEAWVDLLPVEVFLVNNCLDSLREDAILQGQVLDRGSLQVGAVQRLFSLR